MLKYTSTILLAFCGIFALAAWSLPQNGGWKDKISDVVLEKAKEGGAVNVLVILTEQAQVANIQGTKSEKAHYVFNTLKSTAQRTQVELLQLLNEEAIPYRSFYIVNSLQLSGDYSLLKKIAERPEVAEIQDNPMTKIQYWEEREEQADQRDPDEVEWGISRIQADQVWAMGYTGQGVVVGGADTGYDWVHPSLQSKYRGWDGAAADHNYSWHDAIHEINPIHGDPDLEPTNNPCGLDTQEPCDDGSHGTHTMGTMIGSDGDNEIGVAPGAKWVACRNMERGYGTPATYIECFEWFLAPTDLNNENPNPDLAPHVINNSWGCPEIEGCNSDNWATMSSVVDNLKASGIVVVVSAGNSGSQGCGSVSTPAAMFENSFTVGSVDQNDTISNFSSRGAVTVDGSMRLKPNIVAPGRGIRSTRPDGAYGNSTGTSMAGPHVAGMVALLISADPSLAGQVEEIESLIEQTAVPKITDEICGDVSGLDVPNNTYGYGRVDVLAAVNAALQASSVNNVGNSVAIRTFPNPVLNEEVQFELNNLQGDASLEVFNAAGQLLLTRSFNVLNKYQVETVSLQGLPRGIYFYKINYDSASFGGKLMKY